MRMIAGEWIWSGLAFLRSAYKKTPAKKYPCVSKRVEPGAAICSSRMLPG